MMKPRNSQRSANGPALACLLQVPDDDLRTLLERTLEASRFWERLEQARADGDADRETFRILVKPDLEFFEAGGSTGSDPLLAELLIDCLAERGYTRVAVADGPNAAGVWLDNRDVLVLADLVGYRFVTPGGQPYDILDLGEELVDAGFPEDSVLHGSPLAKAWLEASFRINLPKFKTCEEERFALGANNLLGVLPLQDKALQYRNRFEPGDAVVALLRTAPAHFTLIDAFTCNHGSQGVRASNPYPARALIASADLLLADWVGALKMGLDPYASRLNARALYAVGLPASYEIRGDLTPFENWQNVSLLLADSVRNRNRNPTLQRHTAPWIHTVDTELFPFKQGLDSQFNAYLAPLLNDLDAHPLAYSAYLALNGLLGTVENGLRSWQILSDKGQLRRRQVPLGMELSRYTPGDYDAVAAYMEPLAAIADQVPPDHNGLRWRYIDQSVLFEYRRILPLPYDRFVDRVAISRAVEMMYDNIGGTRVPVKTDRKGRIVHQAERNIYLPQPNWMVLFGGTEIDVGKIEVVTYAKDRQQIFWRTVHSANQSAKFDDGLTAFIRHGDEVEIRIVARQKFALPLFWQAINLDYVPELKDRLVSDAYVSFFSRTVANYEAAYEGRDTRAGKPWPPVEGPAQAEKPLAVVQLNEVMAMLTGLVQRGTQPGATPRARGHVDANGYVHVPGNRPAPPRLWTDLAGALQRDLQRMVGLPLNAPPHHPGDAKS